MDNRWPPPAPIHPENPLRAIAEERQRQISTGWTKDHDDEHAPGQLAAAAACYAVGRLLLMQEPHPLIPDLGLSYNIWPWNEPMKEHPERKRLVIAAALIVAEIERLDRAALLAMAQEKET